MTEFYIPKERSKLARKFFARPAEIVAKDLLGRTIVRERPSEGTLYGRIQEVAPWEGKGNMRKESLYAPGTLMVFTAFGKRMMGIATDDVGVYSCVTLLGASIGDKSGRREYADSPSKVASALEISSELNGVPVDFGPLWIGGEATDAALILKRERSNLPKHCLGQFYLK